MNYFEFNKTFFERSFFKARMQPYFDRYPENEQRAIRHYEHNIRLAESLVPSLSVFEALKARWDYQNTIDFAREEGEENKAREIARRMLEEGDSIDRVIRITGLTEEQIQAL